MVDMKIKKIFYFYDIYNLVRESNTYKVLLYKVENKLYLNRQDPKEMNFGCAVRA